MLAGIKGEIDNTIVAGVSDILFLTMEGCEKIMEETLDVRKTLGKQSIENIPFRSAEHTLLSLTWSIFRKGHLLGHKTNPRSFRTLKLQQTSFF